jgi:hypothetical protein
MTRQEIVDQVDKYIYQSITYKSEIESNKLEFKGRKWYDLKTDEMYTCARHITGIANSLGGGDGFLIFGYNTNDQTFHDTKMSDSGYNDPSEIHGVVNRRISNNVSFEVIDHYYEGNAISIVHISPSISKPHILPAFKDPKKVGREFQHVTFIRNGTKTNIATKEDFDRMYMDRTNIFVDHKLIVSVDSRKTNLQLWITDNLNCEIHLNANIIFENLGIRDIALTRITCQLAGLPDSLPFSPRVDISIEAVTRMFEARDTFSMVVPSMGLVEKVIMFSAKVWHIGKIKYQHELDDANKILNSIGPSIFLKDFRVLINTGKEINPDVVTI